MKIEVINNEVEIAVAVKYDALDFSNMGNTMGEGYEKLFNYISQCGEKVSGAPYCRYTNPSEDFMKFDIELGIPVGTPIPEKDDIYMSKTISGKAITAIHKGAYKDIEKTYTPMMQYLADNNLESTGVYYDYYISDPSVTPEDELLTKVVFLIK